MKSEPDIKIRPPGPKSKQIVARDHKIIATSTKTSPLVVKRGEGVFIEDVDGNTFLDFTSGVGVLNVGQRHPKVVKAIHDQTDRFLHYAGTDFYYNAQTRLAETLERITPGKFPKKVFFTNSGAEAVEAAIKLTRRYTRKPRFIAFIRAFHGRTMGALSLTASKPVHREGYFPTMPGVTHIPYAYCYRCPYKLEYPSCGVWCAKILDEVYFQSVVPPDDVAALFLEPVQGEGGYVVPPKKFIPELKKILDKYKIMMVDDEIQAGFGRTGKMFAIEHFGRIEPEVIAAAKGMGSGMPIGAIIFKSKYDFGESGAHSNTYGGNLLACVASQATIDVIKREKLIANARTQGEYLNQRLLELQDDYKLIGDVRGLGLMQVTELVKNRRTKEPAKAERDSIVKSAFKRGLVLLPCGTSGIRYIPPLIITSEQIDMAMEIMEQCFRRVK
ncbi:MAG: acetyl ornithine aminotransferase family protein [Thermoplasmata archaeon]|nr:MAG: acetyl ornithine aminotransferase family protein [Thermoplasmata archaeon]